MEGCSYSPRVTRSLLAEYLLYTFWKAGYALRFEKHEHKRSGLPGDMCKGSTSALARSRRHFFDVFTIFWLCVITAGAAQGAATVCAASAANRLAISNGSRLNQKDQPLRFARVFMPGEIAQFPTVCVNDAPVFTQADVKQRWPDGSVKHAVISVVVPIVPTSGTLRLTFQNQASGNNTALTREQMLDAKFDFDAVIALQSGSTVKSVSARRMLEQGDFEYWASGPVATTIVLRDHSPQRKYDLGFDQFRPFRPIVHATFWPTLNKVEVRVIGENSDSEELEDLQYTVSLTAGLGAPQTIYTKALTHYLGTRWTKRFWLGGQPEQRITIDHGLAYLKQTRVFPNFDTSIRVDEATITNWMRDWDTRAKDLYDPGFWQIAMAAGGGRDEIGPMPTWTVLWLYTGDWRMREIAFAQADLSAAWALHFREGNVTKRLMRTDQPGSATGYGRTIAVTDRKTSSLASGLNYGYTTPDDRLKVVGPAAPSTWTPDIAHQPDAFAAQYALSGDPFYLEQMYLWAGASAHYTNGAATNYAYGRGPTGAEGVIDGEVRALGWVLRNRALTAYLAPDAAAEKQYFRQLIDDALAGWEGRYDVRDGAFYGTPIWQWANQFVAKPYVNPLRFMEKNAAMLNGGQSPWMVNYLIYALGVTKEMGYPADGMLKWLAPWLTGMVTDPSFNPNMVGVYQQPTGPAGAAGFYTDWASVKSASPLTDQQKTTLGDLSNVQHGYEIIAVMAGAFTEPYAKGGEAWQWLKTNGYDRIQNFSTNPKWAIMPRKR